MVELRVREHERPRCPLCKDGLPAADAQRCVSCETPYHPACLGELGGCSTLGCNLQGKLPDTISHWSCRACHRPIDRELTRRNCRCGAYLHDACVEAHGRGCERAAELRWVTGRPAPPRRQPLDPQTRAALRFVLAISAVWVLVAVWASYVAVTQQPSRTIASSWEGWDTPPPVHAADPDPSAPRPATAEVPPRPEPTEAPEPVVPAPRRNLTAEASAADPALTELVASLHHPELSRAATAELRRRWPDDLLPLLDLADVEDPSYTAALRALEVASERDAERVIIDACAHPDVAIRRAAMRALLCLEDSLAVRNVAQRGLKARDDVVRSRAEHALVHFDPAPPIPGFDD